MGQHQTLIVARADKESLADIGRIFAESDATELPHRLGVQQRTLFHFHDLYFHLIESNAPLGGPLEQVRQDPLFQQINHQLSTLVRPYSPKWRTPADAMAHEFYRWNAGEASTVAGR